MHLRSGLVRSRLAIIASIVVVLTLLGAQVTRTPASAAIRGQGKVVGSSILECDELVGSINFQPPWSDSGSGTVTGTVSFNSWSCGGQYNPFPLPVKVRGTGTFTFANGTCTAHASTYLLFNGQLELHYFNFHHGPHIVASTLTLDGMLSNSAGMTSSGEVGDAGTVTGSYPVPPDQGSWGVDAPKVLGTCAKGITKFRFPFSDHGTALQV